MQEHADQRLNPVFNIAQKRKILIALMSDEKLWGVLIKCSFHKNFWAANNT
jgi:small nuclear ribonucleoprotein (snRNP)-like protein